MFGLAVADRHEITPWGVAHGLDRGARGASLDLDDEHVAPSLPTERLIRDEDMAIPAHAHPSMRSARLTPVDCLAGWVHGATVHKYLAMDHLHGGGAGVGFTLIDRRR
jgi:hypothetical protein